jgi:hypothetical protein
MMLFAMLQAALHTVSFVHGKMQYDWFTGRYVFFHTSLPGLAVAPEVISRE